MLTPPCKSSPSCTVNGLFTPCQVAPLSECGQKSTKAAPAANKRISRRSMRVPRRIGIFPLILFYLKIDNICTLVLKDASIRHDAFIPVQYSIDIPRCISHFVYHQGHLKVAKSGVQRGG